MYAYKCSCATGTAKVKGWPNQQNRVAFGALLSFCGNVLCSFKCKTMTGRSLAAATLVIVCGSVCAHEGESFASAIQYLSIVVRFIHDTETGMVTHCSANESICPFPILERIAHSIVELFVSVGPLAPLSRS